jgi:hypothetical protein
LGTTSVRRLLVRAHLTHPPLRRQPASSLFQQLQFECSAVRTTMYAHARWSNDESLTIDILNSRRTRRSTTRFALVSSGSSAPAEWIALACAYYGASRFALTLRTVLPRRFDPTMYYQNVNTRNTVCADVDTTTQIACPGAPVGTHNCPGMPTCTQLAWHVITCGPPRSGLDEAAGWVSATGEPVPADDGPRLLLRRLQLDQRRCQRTCQTVWTAVF